MKCQLAGSKKLVVQCGEDGLTISLPQAAPEPISSTIVLKLKGAPDIQPVPLMQKPRPSTLLSAREANLRRLTFGYRFQPDGTLDNKEGLSASPFITDC
jgi:hypothetical protein